MAKSIDDGDGPGGPSGTDPGSDAPPVGTPGDDVFFWAVGDPTEALDGAAGTDTLNLGLTIGADTLSMSETGSHAQVAANGANVLDLANIEVLNINAADGADVITLHDLSATSVGTINVSLLAFNGQPDGANDKLTLVAADTGSQVSAFTSADGHALQVFTFRGAQIGTVNVSGLDSADQVVLQGGAGADSLSVAGPASLGHIMLAGGAGDDVLTADNTSVSLDGGVGDDTLIWQMDGPQSGQTLLDGGLGADFLDIEHPLLFGAVRADLTATSGGASNLHLTTNSAGMVADTVLSVSNVEALRLTGSSGLDTFTINDQSGTAVRSVDLDLGSAGGPVGDHQVDQVTLNATAGGDRVTVFFGPSGVLFVDGLPEDVTISNIDGISRTSIVSDVIRINTGAGDDLIQVGAANPAQGSGTILIDAGAGHNELQAGRGAFVYEFTRGSGAVDTIDGWLPHLTGGGLAKIDLSSLTGDHSLTDLSAHGHLFSTSDGNVVITDGMGTSITLTHVSLGSLSAGDFIFSR